MLIFTATANANSLSRYRSETGLINVATIENEVKPMVLEETGGWEGGCVCVVDCSNGEFGASFTAILVMSRKDTANLGAAGEAP